MVGIRPLPVTGCALAPEPEIKRPAAATNARSGPLRVLLIEFTSNDDDDDDDGLDWFWSESPIQVFLAQPRPIGSLLNLRPVDAREMS
jgi:hypothetical protein